MLPAFKATLLSLALLLAVASPSSAEMRELNKIKAGTPPSVVIKDLLQANQAAVSHDAKAGGDSKYAPYLTLLADSDPRLQPETMLANSRDKIFTVRNLGNQMAANPGSLDYGVLHLYTPVLLITGNTDSQAIKLAMEDTANLEPEIRRELASLQPALRHDNEKEPFAERWRKNTEANVDYQVEQAMSRYAERIRSGRLAVIGAILDLTNEYRRGCGRLIIINVNGETEVAKIRGLQHLAPFDPKVLDLYLGRYRGEPPTTPAPPNSRPAGDLAPESSGKGAE